MLGHKVIFCVSIKTILKYQVELLFHYVWAASRELNPLGHPANVGKDVGEPSYLDEM